MSLDHHDADAVQRFTDDVDRALSDAAPGFQEWTLRLVATWVVAGLLLTGAVRAHGALSTVLYVLGLTILAVWVMGFYLARGARARWFGSSR